MDYGARPEFSPVYYSSLPEIRDSRGDWSAGSKRKPDRRDDEDNKDSLATGGGSRGKPRFATQTKFYRLFSIFFLFSFSFLLRPEIVRTLRDQLFKMPVISIFNEPDWNPLGATSDLSSPLRLV